MPRVSQLISVFDRHLRSDASRWEVSVQRVVGALETRVGGLLALRGLIDALLSYVRGESNLEEMGKRVRHTFWENRGAVQQ